MQFNSKEEIIDFINEMQKFVNYLEYEGGTDRNGRLLFHSENLRFGERRKVGALRRSNRKKEREGKGAVFHSPGFYAIQHSYHLLINDFFLLKLTF